MFAEITSLQDTDIDEVVWNNLLEIELRIRRENGFNVTTCGVGRPSLEVPLSAIVTYIQSGLSTSEIADLLGVSTSTIGRRMAQHGIRYVKPGTQMEALQKYILRRDQESRSPASSQAGSSQAESSQADLTQAASSQPGVLQLSPTPALSPLVSSRCLRPNMPKVVPRAPSAQGVSKHQPASPAFWEEVAELVAIYDIAPPTND
ncbi:UNVERIFIED_CONTAM: hypothetical protein FKN15_075951 [Acipenser sinensis]